MIQGQITRKKIRYIRAAKANVQDIDKKSINELEEKKWTKDLYIM